MKQNNNVHIILDRNTLLDEDFIMYRTQILGVNLYCQDIEEL